MQNRKKVVNPQQRHSNQQITDIDNDILAEIYKHIQDMCKMRLIQKLARPIDIRSKQAYAVTFQQLLQSTHNKLNKFRTNLIEKTAYEELGKDKSLEEEYTNRNAGLKKKIRAIQSRYNEVFFQGSFKHYPRIKATFNLSNDLQPIVITDWSNQCIEKLAGNIGSCC